METAGVELLNSLRSQAFGKDGRRAILEGLDGIESVLRSFQKQAEADHERMADMGRAFADVLERLRLSEQKTCLLEDQLRLNMARMFGRSSERWKPDERLQALLFNEIEAALKESGALGPDASPGTTRTPRKTRKAGAEAGHGGRKPLPEDLPRRENVIDISEGEKVCTSCGKALTRIGEDVSERLCIEPVKYYVERTVRPTWGCGCGEGGMHSAPVPLHIVPKSFASPSLLAQVVTSKFCDALPFYRQANMFARDGIDISRATMARWALEGHRLLSPMTTLIRGMIRMSPVMNMDESKVRVLHENGKAKEGLSWMWVAAACVELAEPEGTRRDIKLVTFNYAPGRDQEVARELLEGFTGILMSDAYASYNGPSQDAGIIQAACMAHARRKYADVLKVEKNNPKAQVAMGFFSALYDIERECAEKPPDERLKARQEKSLPIMDAFWKWLLEEAAHVLPQSTLGKAINYTIPLWQRLEVFLGDGRVPIDNNLAENAIRPFAVGRRNWLFFDQSEGAEASTSFYTLIETAKANDVEPMHYLRFLFNCIEHFGQDAMPWEKLLPTPAIRDFAVSVGIPYSMV
jgi:transposase